MKPSKIFIPSDSPFITTDTRQNRWAIPYNFECLNHRIDNLLWRQRDAIRGKKILDIASHMGTFSYAALRMGAKFVHGVDTESRMIKKCINLFEQEGIDRSSYQFEVGDIFEFLENTHEFDTILCFGMFYYTAEPYRLLKLMRRAARQTILLDTFTAAYAAVQGKDSLGIHPTVSDELLKQPMLFVTRTQPDKKDYRLPKSFAHKGHELSLTTFPTEALLELWMQSLELEFHRLEWPRNAPCHWRDLHTTRQKKESHWADIYASGLRVSYRMQKKV